MLRLFVLRLKKANSDKIISSFTYSTGPFNKFSVEVDWLNANKFFKPAFADQTVDGC